MVQDVKCLHKPQLKEFLGSVQEFTLSKSFHQGIHHDHTIALSEFFNSFTPLKLCI